MLDRFVTASTKTEKKSWFVSQGISDVSFLEGVSLKDGTQPFDLKWPGRKLPPLASTQSRQHEVEADLLDFYNRFFTRWVSTLDFDTIASEFGADGGRAAPSGPAEVPTQAVSPSWWHASRSGAYEITDAWQRSRIQSKP
jgi:hypothetical protein